MKNSIKIFVNMIMILLVMFLTSYKFNIVFATNETGEKTIEDGVYIIKSALNEKYVLDIYDSSKNNGANLELWTNNKTNNQKFTVKYLGNGCYSISPLHSNQSIDVEGNSKKAGANVLQWGKNNQDNQKWIIKVAGNGYYNVISKSNGLYLDIPESKSYNGANVQVWTANGAKNQMFKFEKQNENTNVNIPTGSKTVEDGTYTIKTALNEKYVLDIFNSSKDNGANLELFTNHVSNNQKFIVKYLNDGSYSISPVHSNKSIDVEENSKKAGANVLQWESNKQDNQKWIIKDAGNGYYNVISKSNGLYLDIPESKSYDGANVQVWTANGAKNQMFKFEKQNENTNVDIPTGSKTIENGIYSIKSATDNNKVLDVTESSMVDGGNVAIWQNNSTSNQKFTIKYLGDGYYTLAAIHSGKYIDVEGASTKNGANVLQWSYNGENNQQWVIKDAGNGYYYIISKCSGLYLTLSSGNICVMKADYSNNQKFKFDNPNVLLNINTTKYPGYKERIEALMEKYPSWNFELLYTGLKFDDVIAGEYAVHSRNLVPTNYSGEWICSICGTKLYDSGWYCASEKAIAYYMDPRNFLDETNIFQFQDLNEYISGVCTLEGIQSQVNGTFLQNYAKDIDTACKNQNVNSYYIVTRMIQEQGRNGTAIGKGMDGGDGKTYYNPFNIGASGNGWDAIYANALSTAKKYGWDSMEKAIEGGITFCKKNWLENYQNTLYQNKFDIDTRNGTALYQHQYMQNLMGAYSEARLMKGMYADTNKLQSNFTFIIPVYEQMSSTLAKLPENNSELSPINVQVTTSSGVNIREDSNTNSKILKTVFQDEELLSVQRGINTNWQKVITKDGTIGYMSGQYLKQIDDITNCNYTAKVKTSDGSGCYVRVGPSTKLDRITALPDGTSVKVINQGTYNNIDGYDWCRIQLSDGRQAFMPSRYLIKN